MNVTAIEYLNKANQDHQAAYNNYIKDCLLSSKQLELSLKDFLPVQAHKNTKRTHKPKDEISITIEELTSHIQQMYNIFNDHQNDMASQGKFKQATEAWNDKQTYKTLLCKIYKKEYVCNIPSYATWQ